MDLINRLDKCITDKEEKKLEEAKLIFSKVAKDLINISKDIADATDAKSVSSATAKLQDIIVTLRKNTI